MSDTNISSGGKHKFTARFDDELHTQITYWAKKKGITINDLFKEAIELYIRHQNRDYDLPELEIQRLNQLIDNMATLSSNVNALERVVVSGFDSLLSLTRGDNYLLDADDTYSDNDS